MASDATPIPKHISQLRCGLGWDVQVETELDLDMAVLALDSRGKVVDGKLGFIYAGHPHHHSGAIQLFNDNITGEGEGDDEQLLIRLHVLPPEIAKLLFFVSIDCGKEQRQDFSQTENAFWRILDNNSQQVIQYCPLYSHQWCGVTTLFVAELQRNNTQWQLSARLEASALNTFNALLHYYLSA